MRRVGIFAGSFDPVHKGHISFALQAIEAAKLDRVVFVPDPLPRRKPAITHIAHRTAMLKLGLTGHTKLGLLELPDKHFTVASSLPRLNKAFPGDELLLLTGTDVLEHISIWPLVTTMLSRVGLVVAARGRVDEQHAHKLIGNLPVKPP